MENKNINNKKKQETNIKHALEQTKQIMFRLTGETKWNQ